MRAPCTSALYLTETTYKPGEEILQQNSPPRSMSFIMSGIVDIRISMNEHLEATMSKGVKGMWKGSGAAAGMMVSKRGRLSMVTPEQQEKVEQPPPPQMSLMAVLKAGTAWHGQRTAAAAKDAECMRLGMLGVGNHVGELGLCTKRRHTYSAIARTRALAHSRARARTRQGRHVLL